jgi:hypothetical protein
MSKLEIGLVLQVISFLEGIWETFNDGDRSDDFDDGVKSLKRAFRFSDDCEHKEEKEE